MANVINTTKNAVSRTLFKSLLRSSRKLDKVVPAAAFPAELASMLSSSSSSSSFDLSSSTSFTEAVKAGFRANTSVPVGSKQFSGLIDGAFTFLQAANKRTAALTAPSTTPSAPVVPTKPSQVVFSVGQVFRHRLYGYKAVIIGWDSTCKASPDWVASTGTSRLPNGTNQPFYHCLVDTRDRPEAQVSYVAQDNIDLVFSSEEETVKHPLAVKYFTTFSEGCFIPNQALKEEYPHDKATIPTALLNASKKAVKATTTTIRMSPYITAAPSAVRSSITDNDLILRAALRLKGYRSASAANVSKAASADASSGSESESDEETATMA